MLSQKLALAAAGNAAADPTYVDDVFSAYTFTGNATARSINNGIDLGGEGGLVWVKDITAGWGNQHHMVDTERGAGYVIYSSSTVNQAQSSQSITGFASSGFSLGTNSSVNGNNQDLVSWSFRKCPGFFDVVTYTGNGTSGRTVAHSLGSTPGAVFIKCTSHSDDWWVWHRSVSTGNINGNNLLKLNSSDAAVSRTYIGTVNSSTFELGTDGAVNGSGKSYVAYIFAHDDQSFGDDSNEAIIKCGSYTGSGSEQLINLGFESQFVMIKKTNSSGNWLMLDIARGFSVVGEIDHYMHANDDSSHSIHQYGGPSASGFRLEGTDGDSNASGSTYVYIAICRSHRPPSTGTEVFLASTADNSTSITTGFDVGANITDSRNAGADVYWGSRLVGKDKYLESNKTDAQTSFGNSFLYRKSDIFQQLLLASGSNPITWMFARRAKFCDVVAYTGNGNSSSQVTHNLNAAPELIIVKQRDATRSWAVYATAVGTGKFLKLETTDTVFTQSGIFDTAPTASNFTVGSNTYVNSSNGKYIAYLFASLDGVSKIGKYTGTGSDVNVDCGFTNGARFVLIKRLTSGWAASWWVFDSVRGITTGNEPGIYLNTNGAEYSRDSVAPLSSGFTVKPGDFELNASGVEYLFFAIA